MIDGGEAAAIVPLLKASLRQRTRYLLGGASKARQQFVSKLAHFDGFESRYACMPERHEPAWLEAELRRRGARTRCAVISEDPAIDARELDLLSALSQVVGSDLGTIIVAAPGRLLYFEGEGGRRLIIEKPPPRH